jgi:hypothetical protein
MLKIWIQEDHAGLPIDVGIVARPWALSDAVPAYAISASRVGRRMDRGVQIE